MAKQNLSMRDIVRILQNNGYNVTYRVRSDGGILITSINGEKFTAAAGNQEARKITGQDISEKRQAQLKQITAKHRKPQLKAKIKSKIKKIQRLEKKHESKRKTKTKRVRYNLENKGEEEALRLLDEAERYASGLAYSKNIEHLIDYIEMFITTYGDFYSPNDLEALEGLIDDIRANATKITEDSIKGAYDELYELNNGKEVRDVVNNVKKVLNIA